MKYIKRMQGMDYIEATRKYLDYLEEHLNNVAKAFIELTDACDGRDWWVGDDCAWHSALFQVEQHDLSKFSKEEFVQYRDYFFPVCEDDKLNSCFEEAWEHHKEYNHHHHETATTYLDLIHMIIDWMAMSYKFGGNPRDFYTKTKPKTSFTENQHEYINTIFNYLEDYRNKK